jgi:hypothetical protein
MDSEINLIKLIIKVMAGIKEEKSKDLLNLNIINWERFKDLIIYHDLTPFAYLALKNSDSFLPQDLKEFLENNYYCALVRCQNLWQEFLRISTAFEQAKINLLPIKGMALLQNIYTQHPLRPMTDIDLLVKEGDLLKAEAIFCDLGYRKELYGLKEEYWRKNQCHITFYKKEDEKAPFIELHWGLDFKRKNRFILPELWERVRTINVDGRFIKVLSPEDTLFSLALHIRRFGRPLCLKNVYDLILLLSKYASNFNWDYVLSQSRKYNIYSTVFFILSQTKLLFELDIPGYVWEELNLPIYKRRLIQKFIEKNTFLVDKKMQSNSLYLKSHFLLYDSLWEPIEYILNIPQEQFAKFYGLKSYDKKTDFLYKNRLFYIPYKAVFNLSHMLSEK